MIIVKGPNRKLLNRSFTSWRKNRKELDDGSGQRRKSNRDATMVCFTLNNGNGSNSVVYLQITSWSGAVGKMVDFTAIDSNGRKVKGQYKPPVSTRERLLLDSYTKIGELEYI